MDTRPVPFGLRRDRNGFRPVFPLGNTLGFCPFDCTFCNVKATRRVDSREARHRFDGLWKAFERVIDGSYHPVIYNQGNGTNPEELAPEVLDHVLETFRFDGRVVFLSLNSRERMASRAVLESLVNRRLPYPIHFIFGQETFSDDADAIIGKRVRGEFDRFVRRLAAYNRTRQARDLRAGYQFGMDVNLLFLPELYLRSGEGREGNEFKIGCGLRREVEILLARASPIVPIEINIHPYVRVEALPYQTAEPWVLVKALPEIAAVVERFNAKGDHRPVHVFVGIEEIRSEDGRATEESQEIAAAIDLFNQTGGVSSRSDLRPGW